MGYFVWKYRQSYEVPHTRRSIPTSGFFSLTNEKLPADALFYVTLILYNVKVGSRILIVPSDDHSITLYSGEATTETVELNNLPITEDPLLAEIRIRKSSSQPYYKPFLTYSFLTRGTNKVYVFQTEDKINKGY